MSRRGSIGGETDCTVVWVRGEHDIATKVSLAWTIARAAELDDVPLLVDLGGVSFMDASTIGALVGSRNRLRSRLQSLEVRAPSPPALRLLELCELAHLVHRGPIETTGAAAALGTRAEVLNTRPDWAVDHDPRRVAEPPATRQPDRVLAAAEVHIEQAAATARVDRGGP